MLGRILLTFGGVLVVALFSALFAPFFVDWTDFRVQFEEQASHILGKKVVVHGAVDARILPFPSVTLHDVRVGQDLDGQPQLHAERFSMDMELAPFLSGEARIFEMRIEEPKARIRILKDGTLDWMRGSKASIPARTVVLEDLHVTDGTIELIDEQTGRTRQLTNLSADFSAGSLAGPWRGGGHAVLDGKGASFNLSTGEADAAGQRVSLRLRLLPDDASVAVNLEGSLALADARAGYDGKFTLDFLQEEDESEPVDAPPPSPRLKGSFELTNERIRVPDYRLEVGALDDPYVVTGEATLDTGDNPEFLLIAEGQQIDVNRLGTGARAKTGRDAAASAQRRIQAVIDVASQIPIPQVPGRASFSLPAVVANDTTVRDIRIDVQPAGRGWTVDSFNATLPGRTKIEAKGALILDDNASFVGDMLLASNQPSGLAAWLSGRVDPAIRQLKTAGFSARVNLTRALQRFENLELAIGPATLKGSVERQHVEGSVPSLTMNLAGDEIDFDAMRALASLITGHDAGQQMLDHVVAANLKAERFTALGVAAEDVDTVFTLSEGALSLEHLSIGDLAGAAVDAQGRLEGSLLSYSGEATATLKIGDPEHFLAMLRDRLPPHPLLEDLAGNARWFKDTDLKADLRIGSGNAGLSAQVNGRSNGTMLEAAINLPGLFDLTAKHALTLSASLENEESAILLGQAGLDPLPLGQDGGGELVIDIGQQGEEPAAVTVTFQTDRTQFQGEGRFVLGAGGFATGEGDFTLRSQNLEPYLLMNGIGIPQFGTGLPVRLAANVAVTSQAIRFDNVDGDVANNALSSDSLVIDRSAPGFSVAGDLLVDTVDLAWLGEAAYGLLTDPGTGALSQKPFSMPIFGRAEAQLKLHAKTFRPGVFGPVTDFTASIVHRNGAIQIEDASGAWLGGRLDGRLAMSNGEGHGIFQTSLSIEDGNLAPMMWSDGETKVAEGRFNMVIAVEATAKTPAELLASLNGSGELSISDFTAYGMDPAALPAILSEIDKIEGEVTEEKVRPIAENLVRRGQAAIGTVTVPLTITDGEVRAQNVAATAGSSRLVGQARIDLLNQALRGDLAMTFDPGKEGGAGGTPMVRFAFAGDVADPQVGFDVMALTNFLSLRAFEQERRRVEILQASVLEKQRLRREVILYRSLAAKRQAEKEKAEAEERARLEEERRQAEAAAAAEAARERAEERAVEQQRENSRPEPMLNIPSLDMLQQDIMPLTPPPIHGLPGVAR